MRLNNFTKGALAIALIMPNFVLAAPTVCSNANIQLGIGYLFNFVTCTLSLNVIPLIITVAVISFIWGMIQMYINPNNEEAKKKGKMFAVWGIIGLFVIISVWGLVSLFSETFGIHSLIPQLSNH